MHRAALVALVVGCSHPPPAPASTPANTAPARVVAKMRPINELVAIDGAAVTGYADAQKRLAGEPGSKVTVRVRDGATSS